MILSLWAVRGVMALQPIMSSIIPRPKFWTERGALRWTKLPLRRPLKPRPFAPRGPRQPFCRSSCHTSRLLLPFRRALTFCSTYLVPSSEVAAIGPGGRNPLSAVLFLRCIELYCFVSSTRFLRFFNTTAHDTITTTSLHHPPLNYSIKGPQS